MSDRHEMRDFDRWQDSLRDFTWLDSHGLYGTDIDWVKERNGKFLILEGKTWRPEGVKVPLGQHITFAAFARMRPVTLFLLGLTHVVGDEYRVVNYEQHRPERFGASVHFAPQAFEPASKEDMRALVRSWMDAA